MKVAKRFDHFLTANGVYKADKHGNMVSKLPSGMYSTEVNPKTGEIYFTEMRNVHDKLIDLPSSAYNKVVSEIEKFLHVETRPRFEAFGYIYKRSSLLYGPPGTGKTCIVNRVANTVIAQGGIVLFNPIPAVLKEIYSILDATQPETLVMVIFEELDQLLRRFESDLLSILDGEIQKENVIYIATTNFIDKVPPRIRRPGRFSSVIEVPFPGDKARAHFLKVKFEEAGYTLSPEQSGEWISKSKGFSIDELSEMIRAVMCLEQDIDDVSKRILENKQDIDSRVQKQAEEMLLRQAQAIELMNQMRGLESQVNSMEAYELNIDEDNN